jgi:hypothetical protein
VITPVPLVSLRILFFIVGMFSDRRQSMMVGMFNRQSILVIDGKIRVCIDGKTGTK